VTQDNQGDYLLGANQLEFDRLRFQHGVWREYTEAFFDRLGVGRGWNCLDVGSGPGFVTFDLRDRVGESGSVTALEPSSLFLDWFAAQVKERGWNNVQTIKGRVEEANLPRGSYDLIFVRWVIAFVDRPEAFLDRLLPLLTPGGVIAIQDYYYEGLSLFPRGGAFDGMADVVRAYYASVGGDPYITGKIPGWLRNRGLALLDYHPHSHAGGPESPIMEWGHRFFSAHIQHMVDKGLVTQAKGDAMLADWLEHRKNPDALYFSPIVVDVAGKKA
jgi:SAM-dependent methyltransferase